MPDMNAPGANVRYLVDDYRARAQIARDEARTLIVRAEIWEEAAMRLEDARTKDERNAQPTQAQQGK